MPFTAGIKRASAIMFGAACCTGDESQTDPVARRVLLHYLGKYLRFSSVVIGLADESFFVETLQVREFLLRGLQSL